VVRRLVGEVLDGGAEAAVAGGEERVIVLKAGALRPDDARVVVFGMRPHLPAVSSPSPLAAHNPTAAS